MAVRITRMELLRLRRRKELATRAKDLLEEKRNILVMELLDIVREIASLQKRVDEKLSCVYEDLTLAQLRMGKASFREVSLNPSDRFMIETTTRSVIGVDIPMLHLVTTKSFMETCPYSLLTTPAKLDESVIELEETLRTIVELAQKEAAIKGLADELKTLKRRVNALEHVIVPRLFYMIKFIEERIEEMERESFFRLKRIKKILARRKRMA